MAAVPTEDATRGFYSATSSSSSTNTDKEEAGFGIGWSKDEYDVSGIPFKDRGARADEFLQLLNRIWTDDVVEYKGKYYNMQDRT